MPTTLKFLFDPENPETTFTLTRHYAEVVRETGHHSGNRALADRVDELLDQGVTEAPARIVGVPGWEHGDFDGFDETVADGRTLVVFEDEDVVEIVCDTVDPDPFSVLVNDLALTRMAAEQG